MRASFSLASWIEKSVSTGAGIGPNRSSVEPAQLAQLGLGLCERDPTVQVDLRRLGRDIGSGDERVDVSVDPDRPGDGPAGSGELGNSLTEQLHIELEADRRDVSRLLGPEKIAGATDLEIPHRDREPGTELRVIRECCEPRPRLG